MTQTTFLDEEELVRVVSATGPDGPEVVDPDQVPLLDELAELDGQAARGEITVDELVLRQSAVFDRLPGSLLMKSPRYRTYLTSIAERSAVARLLLDAYLPADIPGPPERRYRLSFAAPQPPGF